MVNLMGFLDSLDTVIPGAAAGRYQRPSTSLSRHSVVLGRIYIYNWSRTPRKVPLVSPLVKPADTPPGFMPCRADEDWTVQQKS